MSLTQVVVVPGAGNAARSSAVSILIRPRESKQKMRKRITMPSVVWRNRDLVGKRTVAADIIVTVVRDGRSFGQNVAVHKPIRRLCVSLAYGSQHSLNVRISLRLDELERTMNGHAILIQLRVSDQSTIKRHLILC